MLQAILSSKKNVNCLYLDVSRCTIGVGYSYPLLSILITVPESIILFIVT